MTFDEQVKAITQTGLDWHRETILRNSFRNAEFIGRSIRDVSPHGDRALIVSAGPSLYRQGIPRRLRNAGNGIATIVATDGAYLQCLKAGITPDWVITLDPHPTRIVRWFGDPDYSENSKDDDYFQRQDLDIAFRQHGVEENAQNIRAVDEHRAPLVIATCAPANVVARTAAFERYWFAPLVDDPFEPRLTRAMCAATGAPALNTGGTVGTAAWNFAHSVLGARDIGVVGMDFSYYPDTPLDKTQSWHMLGGNPAMYPRRMGHWGECFTDPTYAWYLQNFLDLLESADARIVNCSGGGCLQGERVRCMELEDWINGQT